MLQILSSISDLRKYNSKSRRGEKQITSGYYNQFKKRERERNEAISAVNYNEHTQTVLLFRHKPLRQMYVVGSKSFRPDIQKPRQMENAVRDI